VTHILSDLLASKAISDSNEAINTAIVLPDEQLLLPVLYSIPPEIGKINVTMGYGLSHSSVASLVEHIALLQQNLRTWNGETAFYHRYVKALLNHPLVSRAASTEAESLKEHILTYNRIVVPQSEIPDHPLLTMIFSPMTRWQEIGDYLHRIFSYLYHALTEEKNIDNFIEEKNEDKRSEGKEERKHSEERM